jgi:hypothetical protein
MGGGGMFSIPSEPLRSTGPASILRAEMPLRARPARAADNSAAQLGSSDRSAFAQVDDPSAFTNDAVRASKKKQNDAR